MKKVKKLVIAILAMVLQLIGALGLSYALLMMTACSSWEHQMLGGLAASKSIIDEAGHDYNSGLLSRSQATFDLITKARLVQNEATSAFLIYVKLAYPPAGTPKGSPQDISDAKAKAQQAYQAIAPVIQQVKSIAPASPPPQSEYHPERWTADAIVADVTVNQLTTDEFREKYMRWEQLKRPELKGGFSQSGDFYLWHTE